jgi:RimJ/RimL family protein N-acetyltransferase
VLSSLRITSSDLASDFAPGQAVGHVNDPLNVRFAHHDIMDDSPYEVATDRLLLRAFCSEDFEAYAQMMADLRVAQFLGDGQPLSRADAWRQMAMILGHWTLRGFGLWAVEERATSTLVGRIGCHEPEGWPAFEIGYVLAPRAWGNGYAREGVRAALHFARETLRRDEITSIIRPANAASIRVARACGAIAGETVDFYGAPSVIYRYPRLGGATT